jgi:tetratricopeptide (TPR) repeat protein
MSLLDKARAQEAQGRMDLAVHTWQQVLMTDAKNTEALGNLARAAKLNGDSKLSESYLERLRAIDPKDFNIALVEHAGPTQAQKLQLDQAAKLSEAGNHADAMAIYRQVFGAYPPGGEWGLAYYQTEAATDGGLPSAVEGLRALVARYPADSRYSIALGSALTYDPATREEGRKYLARYPEDPKAAQAFRQSLLWDAANPAVTPQIQAYLGTHPDPQLAAVLQANRLQAKATAAPAPVVVGKQPPTPQLAAAEASSTAAAKTDAVQARDRTPSSSSTADRAPARSGAAAEEVAYEALNANRISEAEAKFEAILSSDSGDSKALAGMGYVRMQQGNFLGAISFLEQAKRGDADDKALFAALDTARFWFIMGEGQNALSGNDLTTAEKRYLAALELRPNNPEALEGLGGTLLKAKQPESAIPLFEHAVQAQPQSVEGWRGLLIAQDQAGHASVSLATVKRIPEKVRDQLMHDPLFLQSLASAYASMGQSSEAETALQTALKQPVPADAPGLTANLQMQLGALLGSENHLDRAAETYKQVLAKDPGNSAAWQSLVQLQHAMGSDSDALQTVQTMPSGAYLAAMRDSGFEVAVASIYQAENKLDIAQDLLQMTLTEQRNAGQKPSTAIEMQLAGIYVQRGRPALAYPIYQQILRENPDRADAWAGLLGALHLTGHDQEAISQLKLIPPGVRPRLEENASYLQTMAGVYQALGRSREATMFLGRIEQEDAAQRITPPAELEIENAWLLYNGMEYAGLYRQLMSLGVRTDLTPDQRRTVQAIWTNWARRRADQAAAARNPRGALAILNAAASAFPDNPAAIKSLAPGYVEAGQPHQAVLIYKSQSMASASTTDYQGAVGAALADGDNKDAEIWLRYALAEYPVDPQVLILAARFEQARGDTPRAINYYRDSLKAMPPASPVSKLSAELGLRAPSAPPTLPSADQPQDISVLLAPGDSGLPSAAVASAAVEPHLPSYSNRAPLPPFDGTSRLEPAQMTNPSRRSEDSSGTHAVPEVEASVRDVTNRTLDQNELSNPPSVAGGTTPSTAPSDSASQEKNGPYVANLAPPTPTQPVANADHNPAIPSAVTVQLGSNTPHPEAPHADVTDVLPTARYAQSARANQAAASHAEVAAARSDRIRRLQQGSASIPSGHSHPPEGTIELTTQKAADVSGAQNSPQVSEPPPSSGVPFGSVANTAAQPYPQPGAPPRSGSQSTPPARSSQTVSPTSTAAATTAATVPELSYLQPTSAAPAVSVVATAPPSSPAAIQPYVPDGPTYPMAPPPTDAELRALYLPPLGGLFEAQAPIPMSPRQQAESEMASLEESYSGWLGATGTDRYRAGRAGLDRLYDVEAPVEASAVIGRAIRLTAVAEPVFLDSGVLNGSSFNTQDLPYLGTLPANAANPPAEQFSRGIGGELQLTTKSIGLAVGYTPQEFLVRNLTARLRWNTLGGHVSLYGERQPVKDTQLSYAGLYDPGASSSLSQRPIWGGVVATTGGVNVNIGNGIYTLYASGDGGVFTGQHVLDNYRFQGNLGAAFRLKTWPGVGSLTIGGALSGLHYAHNEVGLTYGQGGYFSPSSYLLMSTPVLFNGQYKTNFHYSIAGALGVQTFQQDAAPFYPLDTSLESSFLPSNGANCSAAQDPSYNCGRYPLTVSTAVNYSLNSEASYRVADHWYAGVFVFANNANNYNTVTAGFFFRYVVRPQRSTQGYPPGMFQLDGLRSLQIP